MATGDNGKTATSVAKNCGIISSRSYFRIDLDESKSDDPELKVELIDYLESSSGTNRSVDYDDNNEEDNDTEDELDDLEGQCMSKGSNGVLTSLGSGSERNKINDRVIVADISDFMTR